MWKLYDRLIEGISEGIPVDDISVGLNRIHVKAGALEGVAMTIPEETAPSMGQIPRKPELKELAGWVKSWNFVEAGMGAAAINAFYNQRGRIEESLIKSGLGHYESERDAFIAYGEAVKDKKVAVIGHFCYLTDQLKQAAEMVILERRPTEGDYPDVACEYLLPHCDFVFMTGSTLVNKTLPRHQELSAKASVIMIGPTTPMSPVLFDFGVTELNGFVFSENREKNILASDSRRNFFSEGDKLRIVRKDL